MTLSVTVEANVGQFQADMGEAARAVESSTARMNRAVATIDRTGQRFDAVESGIKKVNRALGDATGALTLFGASGSSVGQRLTPVIGTLSAVADAFGTLTTVARGGAAGLGLSAIVPVLGAAAAAATGLYGVYRLLAPKTQEAAEAEEEYGKAIRLSEPYMRRLAEASGELERQRKAEAVAAIQAAQANVQAQIAGLRATEAAQRRGGGLEAGNLGDGSFDPNALAVGTEREVGRLNSQLADLAARLAAINAPAGSAGAGLRTVTTAAETLEAALNRIRASQAGQQYAAGLAQIGQAAEEATAVIQSNLTPLQRYEQELERIGRAAETIYARQGQVEGEATIRRATNQALRQLQEQERQTNRGSEAARELGLTFSSAFEDAIVGGKKLSDVLKGLSTDLARLIVRKSITEPLAAAASSAFNSIGASLFGTGSGSGSGGGSSLVAGASSGGTLLERLLGVNFGFGGARAMGGPVSAGTTYLVGEQGPELFVPGRSGEIVPNGGFGARSGENITVNVDARGSSIGPAELRAAVVAGIAQARALVREDFRRDPGMRALAQGRA